MTNNYLIIVASINGEIEYYGAKTLIEAEEWLISRLPDEAENFIIQNFNEYADNIKVCCQINEDLEWDNSDYKQTFTCIKLN